MLFLLLLFFRRLIDLREGTKKRKRAKVLCLKASSSFHFVKMKLRALSSSRKAEVGESAVIAKLVRLHHVREEREWKREPELRLASRRSRKM